MKVNKWILFSVFLITVSVPRVVAQSVVQKYFPKASPSVLMFRDAGIPEFYIDYYNQTHCWPEKMWLRGSVIPFYLSDYYFTPELQRSVVQLSLNGQTIKRNFNPYRIDMGYFKSRQVSPLALPVIYRKKPAPLLKVETFNPVSNVLDLKSKVKQNDAIVQFNNIVNKRSYSYRNLMLGVYYDNPELVQVHFETLPDPPKLKEGASAERRASRESLAEIFRRDAPALPDKLEKVALHKRPWKFSGSENIQFSQAYLKNWAKGGQNSVSLLSDLRIKAVYEEGKTQWENSAIHKLGIIQTQGSLSRVNDDLIDIASKYGINASKRWYYSFLFNLKTQFFYGYSRNDALKEKPISGFMSPGYFTLAAGMDFKKKNFTLMISPVTSKLTVVLDTAKIDQRRYNIPEDKRSEILTGGSLINNFSWQINKEMKFTSATNIFYDYFEKKDKVQADWDMILDMRINVFLSTRIVANLRYYENESRKLQMRENMGISFRYNF